NILVQKLNNCGMMFVVGHERVWYFNILEEKLERGIYLIIYPISIPLTTIIRRMRSVFFQK
ncbi:MAG: hypothetical protein LBE12_14010, partial [Planctomycetaceae bacterium]|nr:hypothetical protein [Planctomycetaceae bacterium]